MTPRIAGKIPQYLIEVATIKYETFRSLNLKREHVCGNLFIGAEITHKLFEVRLGVNRFRMGAIPAIQIQNFLHHPVQTMRIFLNDRQQTLIFGAAPTFFVQQFGRMVNARKRIADFVGDARGESTQRDQLHLLRLRPDTTGIFDKYDCR